MVEGRRGVVGPLSLFCVDKMPFFFEGTLPVLKLKLKLKVCVIQGLYLPALLARPKYGHKEKEWELG